MNYDFQYKEIIPVWFINPPLGIKRRSFQIVLMMKLTIFLMLLFTLQVSADALGQRISVSYKNASLKTVIADLSRQSAYDFVFDDQYLKLATPITISMQNATMDHVMDQLFKEQPFTYEIKDGIIYIKHLARSNVTNFSQELTVKGKVTDQTGKPLPDVTVIVKGRGAQAITDRDGYYELPHLSQGNILQFRLISHQSFETVVDREEINVVLQFISSDISEIAISVNTGYQSIPKERATGSFTIASNEMLSKQVSTDVLSRLEAIANGLTVDRGTTSVPRITVRGLSTIRGPKDVLVIVDNFPYEGNIDHINPNEVENITILKDAAAASIWGARAGNGVIVITTKKGKNSQPFTIDLNSNITTRAKPDLSYIRQMAASDFIDVEQYLYSKGHYTSWINSNHKRGLSDVVEILKSNPSDAQAQIDALRDLDVRDDFARYFYQRSTNQQYALSLSGGTAVTGWRASVGYDHNLGNLDEKYKRTTVRLQNSYRPINKLQIVGDIYYTQSNQRSGKPGYGSIIQGGGILPYARFADQNGHALPIVQAHSLSYLETAGNGQLLDWKYYPLEDYKYTPSTNSSHDLLINANVIYRIFNGLDLDMKYQYQKQFANNRDLYSKDSYYARDQVNSFTQIEADGKVINIIPPGGVLDLSEGVLNSNSFRGQLNFNKAWSRHDISALVGSELRRTRNMSSSHRLYGYNDDILTFGGVDYSNTYPHFISGSKSYIQDKAGLSDRQTNFVSTFGNAAYTYDRRYILSISGRRDASNLFGLKTNDQWNPFWSGGASWIVSNEDFYRYGMLPFLKLRATYGFSGNIDPGMSAVTTIAYGANSPYTQAPFSRFENYYNPNLRWETSKMLNMGLDFKTKGDVISGSIEYYRKKGHNLFGSAPIDYTAGVGSSIIKNVASMKGNGIDVELRTSNLRKGLKWQTALNLSHFREKVTDYYLSTTQGSMYVTANVPISATKGKPVYSIYGYRWAGLDPQTGDPQGYIDGEISKNYSVLTGSQTDIEDLRFFGSAIPTLFGSLVNTLSYKGITIDIGVVYKFGYYYRRGTIDYRSLFENWSGHSDYSLRWQHPGDEQWTDVPSLVYPAVSARDAFYRGSEVLVERGDHIRLQYINLDYNLDRVIGERSPFSGLRLYANASNLGILWRANKSKIDPDYNYGSRGMPNPASYSIGIRAELRKTN